MYTVPHAFFTHHRSHCYLICHIIGKLFILYFSYIYHCVHLYNLIPTDVFWVIKALRSCLKRFTRFRQYKTSNKVKECVLFYMTILEFHAWPYGVAWGFCLGAKLLSTIFLNSKNSGGGGQLLDNTRFSLTTFIYLLSIYQSLVNNNKTKSCAIFEKWEVGLSSSDWIQFN